MSPAVYWTVPADHPAFAGHFPGQPILPGVALLDTVVHTVAAATGISLDVCAISSVKFLGPARPGDALAIRYMVTEQGAIRFEIAADERQIASGSIIPRSAI